jgi:hypothetical protein
MKYQLEKISDPGVVLRTFDFGDETPPDISHKDLIWVEYVPPPPPTLEQEKEWRNQYVNSQRLMANQTYFTFQGKQIACDQLSRSDIDGVAGEIALTGAFPDGFPGAWKATDNSYVLLPTVDDFKSMYSAMTAQGAANFIHAQTLKAAIEAATTVEEVKAVVW